MTKIITSDYIGNLVWIGVVSEKGVGALDDGVKILLHTDYRDVVVEA